MIPIDVEVWLGHDGVPVVQVDTQMPGRVRINLNDTPVWDGDPETDALPGRCIDWFEDSNS